MSPQSDAIRKPFGNRPELPFCARTSNVLAEDRAARSGLYEVFRLCGFISRGQGGERIMEGGRMLFDLTPEQKKLQGLAREIAEGSIKACAAETDRSETYPWDNVRDLTSAGLMGYTIPKTYGGAGGSFLDASLIVEEMARV